MRTFFNQAVLTALANNFFVDHNHCIWEIFMESRADTAGSH